MFSVGTRDRGDKWGEVNVLVPFSLLILFQSFSVFFLCLFSVIDLSFFSEDILTQGDQSTDTLLGVEVGLDDS